MGHLTKCEWGAVPASLSDAKGCLSVDVQEYATAQDMMQGTCLKAGYAHTLGFYGVGDGGAAYYTVGGQGQPNGMDILRCAKGLVAELVAGDWVTPEQFGAKGDGEHDDTKALQRAIEYQQNKTTLYLLMLKSYITSDDIIKTDVNNLKIKGNNTIANSTNAPTIFIKSGKSFCNNATMSYSAIEGITLLGSRDTLTNVFLNSSIYNTIIKRCNFINFYSFVQNGHISATSKILENNFLTVYYFMKQGVSANSTSLVDSLIGFNYINGGTEMDDNAFMECGEFNGSLIIGNFIDYYQTIYRKGNSTVFYNIQSIGNNYQVFMNLFDRPIQSATFNSDKIGHTSKIHGPAAAKMQSYKKSSVILGENIYELNNSIIPLIEYYNDVNLDLILGTNIGNLVEFIDYSSVETGYYNKTVNLTIHGISSCDSIVINQGNGCRTATNGTFTTNIIERVNTVPKSNSNWGERPPGWKIIAPDGYTYKLSKIQDGFYCQWVRETGVVYNA